MSALTLSTLFSPLAPRGEEEWMRTAMESPGGGALCACILCALGVEFSSLLLLFAARASPSRGLSAPPVRES